MEAPRLKGIRTADFIAFKQEREIYEPRIAEKNSDPNVRVQKTTYEDSIEPSILQIFAMGSWVPVDTVVEITVTHLKTCVSCHAKVRPENYDLGRLEYEIRNVKMDKHNSENSLQSQVSFGRSYSSTHKL